MGRKKRENTHFCLLPLRESSCTSGKDCRTCYQLKLVREELLIFWVLSFSVHLQMSHYNQRAICKHPNRPLQSLLSSWVSMEHIWFSCSVCVVRLPGLFPPNMSYFWIHHENEAVMSIKYRHKTIGEQSVLSGMGKAEFMECWQGVNGTADR